MPLKLYVYTIKFYYFHFETLSYLPADKLYTSPSEYVTIRPSTMITDITLVHVYTPTFYILFLEYLPVFMFHNRTSNSALPI